MPDNWSGQQLASRVAVLEAIIPEIRNTLNRIENQTTATNGRVGSLELTRANAVGAKWALGVLFTLGCAVGGLIGHFVK
jgi:hypothetical protein